MPHGALRASDCQTRSSAALDAPKPVSLPSTAPLRLTSITQRSTTCNINSRLLLLHITQHVKNVVPVCVILSWIIMKALTGR